ncbi:MAG: ion transporter [Spirochaetales bacterium]|nr:ion transporter [Spirochaetales bacterium]
MKKSTEILENVVIIVIFLVIIQTFLEDFFVLAGASWSFRKILVFSGFFFDLFFTVEFLTRLYNAIIRRQVREYLVDKRGWIDFAASIPLLLLNSGLSVFSLVLGTGISLGAGGFLNILKVIKAIRIARILRILKVFKQIRYTDSKMAQHHVTKITSIAVSSFVFILLCFSVFSSLFGLPRTDEVIKDRNRTEAENILYASEGDIRDRLALYSDLNEDLLIIRQGTQSLYKKYDASYLERMFSPEELQYIPLGEYVFIYNLKAVSTLQSRENLQYFIIVVLIVLILMFYYSPHFAINITDPVQVMRKGFTEKDYSLEVKIQERYSDHEVFALASAYNEKYLPLKARTETRSDEVASGLKMDDVRGILEKGLK